MDATTETLDTIEKRMSQIAKEGGDLYAQLLSESAQALAAMCTKLPTISDPEEMRATMDGIYSLLSNVRSLRDIATALGKRETPAAPAAVPVVAAPAEPQPKTMSLAEFYAYAVEQTRKACGETPEKQKPRMKALAEALEIAKAKFVTEKADAAAVMIYVDPWQVKPTAPTEIAPQAAAGGAVAKSEGEPAAPAAPGTPAAPAAPAAAPVAPAAPAPVAPAPFQWPADLAAEVAKSAPKQ